MSNSRTYFDDALQKFAALVASEWGVDALNQNLFLRDASGRLTFIVRGNTHSKEQRQALARKAADSLAPYVDREGFAVATPGELFDDTLDAPDVGLQVFLHDKLDAKVRIVDRRMVGGDWLRKPVSPTPGAARIVFASLKGGVGRSTALCVSAAHLAARGRRVLAIDMDLEAPGLGNMLLPKETLPDFGLLDYFVEQSLAPLDEAFERELIGASWLGGGLGRVDVVPAIGRRSLSNPANVLAKLARAYLSSSVDAVSTTFSDHFRLLIERLASSKRYDAILIDARAGLHETTAAAIVGIGADVLFFGLDQPQTFAGYELLLSHLATLPRNGDDDWRDRFRFVQAKAPDAGELRRSFAEGITAVERKYLWRDDPLSTTEVDLKGLKDTFEVEWVDTAPDLGALEFAEPQPMLAVLDDTRYRSFDPLVDRSLLELRTYSSTFNELLDVVFELVEESMELAK